MATARRRGRVRLSAKPCAAARAAIISKALAQIHARPTRRHRALRRRGLRLPGDRRHDRTSRSAPSSRASTAGDSRCATCSAMTWNSCASRGVKQPMQSRGNLSSEHDRHDRLLVARYAAGDAYESEIVEAKDLVDNCDGCAALAADIRLISAKTAELPAATRPRDFRITPEQAEKLRGSWFDRLMRGFSSPGWSVVRPVAAASLAIGMVLIVVVRCQYRSRVARRQKPSQARTTLPPATAAECRSRLRCPPMRPCLRRLPLRPVPLLPLCRSSPRPHRRCPAPPARAERSELSTAPRQWPRRPRDRNPRLIRTPRRHRTARPRLVSSSPAATEGTGKAVAGASAPPANLGGAGYGQAQVGTVSESTFDRSSLVLIGIVIAFFALMALGLVWLAGVAHRIRSSANGHRRARRDQVAGR